MADEISIDTVEALRAQVAELKRKNVELEAALAATPQVPHAATPRTPWEPPNGMRPACSRCGNRHGPRPDDCAVCPACGFQRGSVVAGPPGFRCESCGAGVAAPRPLNVMGNEIGRAHLPVVTPPKW
jgi:hypothetical protein